MGDQSSFGFSVAAALCAASLSRDTSDRVGLFRPDNGNFPRAEATVEGETGPVGRDDFDSPRIGKPPNLRILRNPPSAPFPTVAQLDYIQNGLVLPKDPKNHELIRRDVDAEGYLDIELVYLLRQKESLGSVKQKIVRKIQQNESAFCFEDLVVELLDAV